MEGRSCNHCSSRKEISIKQPESVYVDLGIQHAMRMRHIFICGKPRSAILFPHYFTNGTILEKKRLLELQRVFWFRIDLLSETFLILRRTERNMIKNNNYIFRIPTKCTYRIQWNMCVIINTFLHVSKPIVSSSGKIFIVSSKLLLHCLITDAEECW